MASFFYFYQAEGKESKWTEALADRRVEITRDVQPAFSTVLDLSAIPEDNDWSKVKYRGPFYADFDAGDDLPLVCDQFKNFLGKLDAELNFDLSQARFYASGSKGFHIEIPWECFIPKPPAGGVSYLAYVYREMAQRLIVDTLDLNVYTGKRGRQWRTTNVERENGCYKVPLTLEEAMSIDEDMYREIIKEPRPEPVPAPPQCNAAFSMLYDTSREKVTTSLRGKKKRMATANAILDPYKKAGKNLPSVEKLMNGEDIAEGAGFQNLSMQLAIYAASVGMERKKFIADCKGLIENHVSDSSRYNTVKKRVEELERMFDYMSEDAYYDFDVGPIVRLLRPGTHMPDLGVMEREDREDAPTTTATATTDTEDGDAQTTEAEVKVDHGKGVRKGFFMNSEGMFRQLGENTEVVCRGVLRRVESFFDLDKHDIHGHSFSGYEFDVIRDGRKIGRKMLGSDTLTSSIQMRKFFAGMQLAYQGGDTETAALMDILSEKAARGGKVYTYPREGFFIIDHPEKKDPTPVAVYLTQDTFISSLDENDPDYFIMRYRPSEALSTYCIDIHNAPDLCDEMRDDLENLFNFNHPDVVCSLVGWFVASYFRSHYLRLFHQFPILQIFGEAGSGKTQTVFALSRLHFYKQDMGLATASSYTNFTLDNKVNTSHSAPAIIDEYKPRELRSMRGGKYEKIKDVMKNSYVGGDTGNRGTINKTGETSLAVVKSKCAAPLIFMGEAIENETAILERCVIVKMSKDFQTPERTKCFKRIHDSEEGQRALSALGKFIVMNGFHIDFKKMYGEVEGIVEQIKANLPDFQDKEARSMAERMIFNMAIVIHGWTILKRILNKAYGTYFDARIDEIIASKVENSSSGDDAKVARRFGRSEISKTISQIAMLSREQDRPYELRYNKDYIAGDGFVELRVEKAYSLYRIYCGATHEQPLFDNLDSFCVALSAYSPVVDHICASSELREDGSTETIHRFDTAKLMKDGVQQFRN